MEDLAKVLGVEQLNYKNRSFSQVLIFALSEHEFSKGREKFMINNNEEKTKWIDMVQCYDESLSSMKLKDICKFILKANNVLKLTHDSHW